MKNKIQLHNQTIQNFFLENKLKYNIEQNIDELINTTSTLAIIPLTIINSLNHKTKKTLHGYYIALFILLFQHDTNKIITFIKILDDNIKLMLHECDSKKILNINFLTHDILFKKIIKLATDDKIIISSQLALLFGWIFGLGILNTSILDDLEQAGEYLGNIILLTQNFKKENFNDDFDKFIKYKHKFIDIMITHNIFSNTVKQIINSFELQINKIANQ